jgi:hypothetical protein
VRKDHRTVEDDFLALQGARFEVETLRESKQKRELFPSEEEYARRARIPLFLFVVGAKRSKGIAKSICPQRDRCFVVF